MTPEKIIQALVIKIHSFDNPRDLIGKSFYMHRKLVDMIEREACIYRDEACVERKFRGIPIVIHDSMEIELKCPPSN